MGKLTPSFLVTAWEIMPNKKKSEKRPIPGAKKYRELVRAVSRTQLQDGVAYRKETPTFLNSVSDAIKTFGPLVSGLAKVVGMGDYVVDQNSVLTSGAAVTSVPNFPSMSNNRVRHKECLGVIRSAGNTNFSILRKLRFNPGDPNTFPWLNSFAGNFTSYKVHGAVLVFETNTSDYAATPYLGTVCIGTRYDTREPDFVSMTEMQNCKFSVSAKPSQSILHPIECKDGFQPFDTWQVRRGNETDVTYGYDKCTVFVAAEGLQGSSTVIGRLWVSYDIELLNPVTPSAATVVPLSTLADTGGNTTLPTSRTATTHPWVTLFNNFNYNSSYNTTSRGDPSAILKGDSTSLVTPYAALMADGTIRVYKTCTISINTTVAGTTLTPGSLTCAVTAFPGDGSGASLRRALGTPNSATALAESDVIYCSLLNPQSNTIATNTYYVEITLSGIGTGITSSATQIYVHY